MGVGFDYLGGPRSELMLFPFCGFSEAGFGVLRCCPQGLSWEFLKTGSDSGVDRKLGSETCFPRVEIGSDSGGRFFTVGGTKATASRRTPKESI